MSGIEGKTLFFLCFLYVLEFVGCVVDYAHYVTRKTSISSKSASHEIVVIEIGTSNLVLAVVSFHIRYSMNDEIQQVETKETTRKINNIDVLNAYFDVLTRSIEHGKRSEKKNNFGHFVQLTWHWIIFIFGAETQNRGLSTACSLSFFVCILMFFFHYGQSTRIFFSTFRVVVIRLCILHHTFFFL